MRWLAVDPGDKYIGAAISDAAGLIARPLTTLRRQSYVESASRLVALAEEHNVAGIIVGLPLDEEGEMGPQARKAGRLAEAIRARTTLAVILHDESLSSRTAHALKRAARGKKRPAARAAKRRERSATRFSNASVARARAASDHAAAAAVILQDYLDAYSAKASPG